MVDDEAIDLLMAGMKDLHQGEQLAEQAFIEAQQILQIGLVACPVSHRLKQELRDAPASRRIARGET